MRHFFFGRFFSIFVRTRKLILFTLIVFFIITFGIYYYLTAFLIGGLRTAIRMNPKKGYDKTSLSISVVVAFKNEEDNVKALIDSLKAQDFPKDKFDLILVDDHSTDRSVLNIIEEIKSSPNFKLLSAPWDSSGKKKALTFGIEKSGKDIIATTDADCIAPAGWLTGIEAKFKETNAKMIFGGVRIQEEKSFFSRLQAIEFSSLIASAAATITVGFPSMCSGANLAFLRSAFKDVVGYEGNIEIASGDDEFLMRKIHARWPRSIFFLNHPQTIITTKPQASIQDFLHQRLRWAAKWRANKSQSTIALAWFILIFQTSYVAVLILLFLKAIPLFFAISLLVGKALIEFIFLLSACKFLKVKWRTSAFIMLQLLYPVYVILVGLLSNFISFRWKGERYKM